MRNESNIAVVIRFVKAINDHVQEVRARREKMELYQQRVVAERAELSERLGKLLAFFQSEAFAKLSEAERSRLRNPARFMDGYLAVLEERIAALKAVTE